MALKLIFSLWAAATEMVMLSNSFSAITLCRVVRHERAR